MKILIVLLIFSFSTLAQAQSYCKRESNIDPEFPAGISGIYDIIGRDPISRKPYSGTVIMQYSEHVYKLTRTIEGKSIKGAAWLERCGPDKHIQLKAKYDFPSQPLELRCTIDADGGNYYRITCITKYENIKPKNEQTGLEALFQRHAQ